MDEKGREEVELVAEVIVQRFFAHYLDEVFPEQLSRLIGAHNSDVAAHAKQITGAVKAESSRVRLWIVGLIFTGGVGGGVGLARMVSVLTGG